jgi:hypothetical protein
MDCSVSLVRKGMKEQVGADAWCSTGSWDKEEESFIE